MVVTRWWRGERLPPTWLALALSALDAGDVVGEPLTSETLRDRMAERGWGPAGLAAALGVARAAITGWQSGRTSPAAGVTLALAEAGPPGRGRGGQERFELADEVLVRPAGRHRQPDQLRDALALRDLGGAHRHTVTEQRLAQRSA